LFPRGRAAVFAALQQPGPHPFRTRSDRPIGRRPEGPRGAAERGV
jgi:hypothetical protein